MQLIEWLVDENTRISLYVFNDIKISIYNDCRCTNELKMKIIPFLWILWNGLVRKTSSSQCHKSRCVNENLKQYSWDQNKVITERFIQFAAQLNPNTATVLQFIKQIEWTSTFLYVIQITQTLSPSVPEVSKKREQTISHNSLDYVDISRV